MPAPLPIERIFLEAVELPAIHWRPLLKAGLPLIVVGSLLFGSGVLPIETSEGTNGSFSTLIFIAFLLLWVTLVMAIIACHRIFLLGPKLVENAALFNWTGNELRYIGWTLLIGLCAAVVAIPFGILIFPLMAASSGESASNPVLLMILQVGISIPVYYVISRLSLVLPAAAIDGRGLSFGWAWELSYGNGWRLTVLVSLLPVLMDLVLAIFPFSDSTLLLIVQGVLWLVIGVVQIGLLSLSYKFLSNNDAENAVAI